MAKCEPNSFSRIINQNTSPFCDLITICNLISINLGIPINVVKFIKCLSSDDSKPLYQQKNFQDFKKNNLLSYITSVKIKNLLQSFEPQWIYASIDYNALCASDYEVVITQQDIDDIILAYNNKNYDSCKDCGLSAKFIAGNIINQDDRVRVSSLCKFIKGNKANFCNKALGYTLETKHQLWLQSLTSQAYDVDDIPEYDMSSKIDGSDSKNYTLEVFPKILLPRKEVVNQISSLPGSVLTCSQNHNLQVGDYIALTNADDVVLPEPLNFFNTGFNEVVLKVSSVGPDPTKLTVKMINRSQERYYIKNFDGNLTFFTKGLNDKPENYNQQIFQFKKVSYRHRVTLIDCEQNTDDSYTFTAINTWGLNKSYKTKFRVSDNYNMSYTYNANMNSIDDNIYVLTQIGQLFSSAEPLDPLFAGPVPVQTLPTKNNNWSQFLPQQNIVDPCGYCKYCCDPFGYSPPDVPMEDKISTYLHNVGCIDLGYDLLSYNPMRPHECECVCEQFYYHNGTTCVPIEGAWCVLTKCNGQSYVTGCQEGTMAEWAAQYELDKAGDFNRDGTCGGNPFSDIYCEIDTLPSNCSSSSSSSSGSSSSSEPSPSSYYYEF